MLPLLDLLQEHQGGAASGPFAINPGLIIWTLIVFGILLVLLWRLAFPAIVRSVAARERRIQKQLDEAEKANAEAQRLLEEPKKQIAATRTAADNILGKSKTVAQQEPETMSARAREECDALLARARQHIGAGYAT